MIKGSSQNKLTECTMCTLRSTKRHSLVMARSANGDLGGVSACCTVNVCRKSAGRDIWPGSFFSDCNEKSYCKWMDKDECSLPTNSL